MQLPVSDIDFYERKITRLEKDIANLNQQLTVARSRLRSAQDFQIKYQLLLRQSQQQTFRVKKAQQAERAQLAQLMSMEIEEINQQWKERLGQLEKEIREEEREEKGKLRERVEELERKNRDMSEKVEQMDVLLFKNKKIAKDLESLEEIIQENRISNEKQRQQDLRNCKQTLTKKFMDRIKADKDNYDQVIKNMEERYQKLEIELMKAQLTATTNNSVQPHLPQNTENNKIQQHLQDLQNLLKTKDQQLEHLRSQKISSEQHHTSQLKSHKKYHKELQDKIYALQTQHQVELINFKNRMEEIRGQVVREKERQCEITEKQHMKDMQMQNEKILKEKADLENIRRIEEAQIEKLKEDKNKLLRKIAELKDRLKNYQQDQQNGQTLNLLQSLKTIDKKQDDQNSYEDGVTFLERQLKKTTIKLQKKNLEVKQLVTKMNNLSQEFEKELADVKEKFVGEKGEQADKIQYLEEEIKGLNEHIRKKEKQGREVQAEYIKKLNQINAENRSLINMNNDLQRDYNRILESKKTIQKSFREQRQRSITSKSQIAIAKKQKWLELQRQKNEIQIIYKEKQEQLKTNFEIQLNETRTELDKIKRDKELLEQEVGILKEKLKNNGQKQQKGEGQKENAYSEYHKKLASVNLEIALTQNLYNTLLKAKHRVKKPNQNQKQPQSEPKNSQQELKLRKKAQFEAHLNKIEQKGYKSFQRSVKEIQKLSQNQSRQIRDSRDLKQDNQHPLAFDDSIDEGGASPTFKMLHSFNPQNR